MKTTSTYLLTPILFLSMSLFCFGAEDELATKMQGRWQDVNGEYGVLEFFADGSFAMEIRSFKEPWDKLSGKWLVLEDGRVQMDTIAVTTNTVMVDVTFEADELLISKVGGSVTRYRRAEKDTADAQQRLSVTGAEPGVAVLFVSGRLKSGRSPLIRFLDNVRLDVCGNLRLIGVAVSNESGTAEVNLPWWYRLQPQRVYQALVGQNETWIKTCPVPWAD